MARHDQRGGIAPARPGTKTAEAARLGALQSRALLSNQIREMVGVGGKLTTTSSVADELFKDATPGEREEMLRDLTKFGALHMGAVRVPADPGIAPWPGGYPDELTEFSHYEWTVL